MIAHCGLRAMLVWGSTYVLGLLVATTSAVAEHREGTVAGARCQPVSNRQGSFCAAYHLTVCGFREHSGGAKVATGLGQYAVSPNFDFIFSFIDTEERGLRCDAMRRYWVGPLSLLALLALPLYGPPACLAWCAPRCSLAEMPSAPAPPSSRPSGFCSMTLDRGGGEGENGAQ